MSVYDQDIFACRYTICICFVCLECSTILRLEGGYIYRIAMRKGERILKRILTYLFQKHS